MIAEHREKGMLAPGAGSTSERPLSVVFMFDAFPVSNTSPSRTSVSPTQASARISHHSPSSCCAASRAPASPRLTPSFDAHSATTTLMRTSTASFTSAA
eukprot:4060541-Pleurochrysis_carterae.AAC.1